MINYQKQLVLDKPSISIKDSKWKIYETFNDNKEKDKELLRDNNIENIKSSIYSKINQNSSQQQILLEKYKSLKKENLYLKQIIKNKDKLISDFAILFQQFKDKFIKFEEINQTLKRKLKDHDLLNKNENWKENINRIENDYNAKLKEKDKILEKMNENLIYMHNEYKNLTNNIEQVNNYILSADYNELKNKIKELLREKEILIQQNQKREKRIIDLIKMNETEQTEKDGNEINEMNNDEMIITFKNQENEYIKTINMLQNRIIDKDKEIKMIKEEFKKILND